jgi:2-keto-4-pentenoate hydratase/2-oxohepta-3-ene-1,7-dioic acid hydratase in catechol pathway
MAAAASLIFGLRQPAHSFEEFIAYVLRDETIHAGEFLASGTMGFGSGLEQDQFLNYGDTIELEIEKIGILRNSIAAAAPVSNDRRCG